MTRLTYKTSMSMTKQSDLDITPYSTYIRKNHRQEEHDGATLWVCEEAILSPEEFSEYSNELVLEKQAITDANQLTIMEAIADLYDMIAELKQGGTE